MLDSTIRDSTIEEKFDLRVEELEDAVVPSGWDWAIYGGGALGGIALGYGAGILVAT